ncbi:MAG: hypothetical protein HKP29_02140 [Silicimonas sp.]|nr:hypothetical protein [Silicimonas sp.]
MSRKIAVLGLGSRGSAWAEAFRDAGWRVSGFDPDPIANGPASGSRGWRRETTISSTASHADWVILCLPERLELVQKVIQRAQAEAPAGAIIAVVSARFDIDAVQGCAVRPERVVLIDGLPGGNADLNLSQRNPPDLKVDALSLLSQVCPGADPGAERVPEDDQKDDARSA